MIEALSQEKEHFHQSLKETFNTLKKYLPENYNPKIIENDFSIIYDKKHKIEALNDSFVSKAHNDILNNFYANVINDVYELENDSDITIYIAGVRKKLQSEYDKIVMQSNDMYL